MNIIMTFNRDGSAVELVGMCAGVVKWLSELNNNGLYPYDGVEVNKERITFSKWYETIKANFERYFYVSDKPDPQNEPNPELISRRGIYKDSHLATQFWADYQLRCNFPVAMMACPDIFTPERAWIALETAGTVLLGPLGMKTLDPKDWAYNGDYNNDNDTSEMAVAKGWNYHQGPEWVWPVGFFLRAKLYFAGKLEAQRPGLLEKTKLYVNSVLCKHYEEILNNPWQGLPELTNSNGQYCAGSCRTQAWSAGTILETMYDLAALES
uniref:Glycogen debranching enzyme C-terminal domain-containing protein n=1 Tax=Arion vulgaris TaxID=1028688 RepID=A0A0B7B7G7_9EUPU